MEDACGLQPATLLARGAAFVMRHGLRHGNDAGQRGGLGDRFPLWRVTQKILFSDMGITEDEVYKESA